MEQSTSWEANWFSASQEIHSILWNPKVLYRIHKCPPPVRILRHSPGPRLSLWTFHNKICFYGDELLGPRPLFELEDHPLSAVRDYFFSIYSQLPSILEAVPTSATEDAQCCGDTDPSTFNIIAKYRRPYSAFLISITVWRLHFAMKIDFGLFIVWKCLEHGSPVRRFVFGPDMLIWIFTHGLHFFLTFAQPSFVSQSPQIFASFLSSIRLPKHWKQKHKPKEQNLKLRSRDTRNNILW